MRRSQILNGKNWSASGSDPRVMGVWSGLKTAVHADIAATPFAAVNGGLNDPGEGPANRCGVLILHMSIKYCRSSTNGSAPNSS